MEWFFSARLKPVSTPFVRTAGDSRVRLRSLGSKDGDDWRRLRIVNEQYLRPVEPTIDEPWEQAHSPSRWRDSFIYMQESRRQGTLFPMVIEADGRFAGQLTLGNIQHGSVSCCWVGYWVDFQVWGRGVATAAVALGTDFAMRRLGLHRVEATVLPDNVASIAVLRKAGFRQEGYLERNLHIDGQWRDHLLVAQTVEESMPGGVVHRLINDGVLRPGIAGPRR